MAAKTRYWLMKTEPETFSFDDLLSRKNQTESWDGVRNYQARNLMRDEMKKGDLVFIYHSRTKDPSIVGIAEIVREGYADHTALDPKCPYFDPKSAELGESRWVMVDVQAKKQFANPVPLSQLRTFEELDGMALLKPGQRLSVQPVEKKYWDFIVKIGKARSC